MINDNPYLQQVYQNLPRILSLYDTDSSSETYGVGDRFFWAWKLIDFPNGTYQALVSGLALLIKNKLYPPNFNESRLLERIDTLVVGLKKITSKNGSLDEALPNERSFCVTGLVAAEVLFAAQLLKNDISEQKLINWLEIVRPLIHFLYKQDEFHGLISNHLATCALALVRWADFCPQEKELAEARAQLFLQRILCHQSKEGWFKEYEGADPGYQSWCLSSLVLIDSLRPEWKLESNIRKAIHFLTFATHPDGSYGGNYGSRMTRFVFPFAFESYATRDKHSAKLASFFRTSISTHACVTLNAIDSGNLIPLFNDYVHASIAYLNNQQSDIEDHSTDLLPYEDHNKEFYFPEAGWLIYAHQKHYTVMNIKKAGTGLRTFHNKERPEAIYPPCLKLKNGKLLSGGFYEHGAEFIASSEGIQLLCSMKKLSRPIPSALKFLVLRVLSLSVFFSMRMGNCVKILLVKYLVNKKTKTVLSIKREIQFKNDNLIILDAIPETAEEVHLKNFQPIHMASQGYWQIGDEK